MKSSRRATAVLAAATAVVLMSGGMALTTRAQAAPTGRGVALELEKKCDDKTETLYALAEDGSTVTGRWITVAGPTFDLPEGAPHPGLMAHAVDPVDPRRLLVTEGEHIYRSADGGCTWSEVHHAPSTLGVGINLNGEVVIHERIRQLEIAGRGDQRRAYAVMAPKENEAGAIRVIVSDDGGSEWQERSAGLPPAYTRYDTTAIAYCDGPCPTAVLAVSPGDPDVAYLAVSEHATMSIYSTTNAGRTWARLPITTAIGGGIGELQVSPEDPNELWGIFTAELNHSRDGGRSWERPGGLTPVRGLHLSSGVSPQQVQVLRRRQFAASPYDRISRSVDGGETFTDIELSDPISGIPATAAGGPSDELVLSTDAPDGVVRFDPAARKFTDISAVGLGDVTVPKRDATAAPAFWFRQFRGLAAFVPGAPPPDQMPPTPPRLPFDPVTLPTGGLDWVPGSLVPHDLDVEVGREGTRVLDYRLDLPALPTPVDIWFLMDTSGSMAGAIEGLRQGFETIIHELSASGLDAEFGLASFPAQSVIYDRLADLAPPNDEFYAALERLTTDGQTNEIHATALYQSVTGEGQEDAGIPAGRGASFRPQALKIIIHATDEAYGTERGGPSQDEAAEAMAVAGVRHVGLDLAAGAPDPQAGADTGGVRSTKRDHDAMAIATDTLAPDGGIDCNGDGTNELEAGDPITCPIVRGQDSLAIAPAIIAAVRGVRDETEVALNVVDGGGLAVEIGDPRRSPVNVKTPNSLPFAVRYTCPPEMTGKIGEVRLRATVRGVPSAEGVARVGCGVPVPAVAPPPPDAPAAAVPIVLAPPQLVPNVEPSLSPLNQTAPGQVAQPTPQAGMAAQPGQVEVAKQRAGRDGPPPPSAERGEAREERSPAPAAAGTLGAGAAMAVALGGWAVRRERRMVTVGVRA